MIIENLKQLKIPGINLGDILKKAQKVDNYNHKSFEVVCNFRKGKVMHYLGKIGGWFKK